MASPYSLFLAVRKFFDFFLWLDKNIFFHMLPVNHCQTVRLLYLCIQTLLCIWRQAYVSLLKVIFSLSTFWQKYLYYLNQCAIFLQISRNNTSLIRILWKVWNLIRNCVSLMMQTVIYGKQGVLIKQPLYDSLYSTFRPMRQTVHIELSRVYTCYLCISV